jgi:hypothetical protein
MQGPPISKNEKLEEQMAAPLAAALVAVAIFSLTAMGFVSDPRQSFVDEVFMALGLISLLSAARIIDVRFDKVDLTITDRFELIGGGYFLFCFIVGAMSFAILLLYVHRRTTGDFPLITLAPSLMTWVCITGMLMSQRGSEAWFVGVLVAVGLFIITLFLPL